MKKLYYPFLALVIGLSACNRFDETNDDQNAEPSIGMEKLNIDDNFDWENSKPASIKITARDNQGNPLNKVRFEIWTADPEEDGELIMSGYTDHNGQFQRDYEVPAYY